MTYPECKRKLREVSGMCGDRTLADRLLESPGIENPIDRSNVNAFPEGNSFADEVLRLMLFVRRHVLWDKSLERDLVSVLVELMTQVRALAAAKQTSGTLIPQIITVLDWIFHSPAYQHDCPSGMDTALLDTLKGIGANPWLDCRTGELDGHHSLEMIHAFITGFQYGSSHTERYPHWVSTFTPWVHDFYDLGPTSADGLTLIKRKVGYDDRLAFDEFFRLLPLFEKDIKEIGLDGIMHRHHKNYEKWAESHRPERTAPQ